MNLTNHKSHQKLCELIELWVQALIRREVAKKRLAEVEATFHHYAMKITCVIGQTEYERYYDKYLNAIQSGCHYCYSDK